MAKILLVEDDMNLLSMYTDRLRAENYEIVTARDGEEALTVAVKEKPDLIISDVMMPKISGFDMLDILRSTPETKNAKVIMMTALSQAEDRERAERLGADKYLVKSQVTLDDVANIVNELFTAKPAEANNSAVPAASNPTPTEPPKVEPAPVAPPADLMPAAANPVAPAPADPMPAATSPQPPASPAVPEPSVVPADGAPVGQKVITPLGDSKPDIQIGRAHV